MAAVTFVVAGVLPSAWPPGLRLPIEVATGVAVYSVTTWMIKRSLIDEALALLRR
jgi:hypothetical protein